MNHTRLVAGSLLLAAVLVAALASGGFSASELDRNVDIEVVDDSNALVNVEVTSCSVTEHTNQDGEVTDREYDLKGHITSNIGGEIEEIRSDEAISQEDINGKEFKLEFDNEPSEITVVVKANVVTAQVTTTDFSC